MSKTRFDAECSKLKNGIDTSQFKKSVTTYGVGLHCPLSPDVIALNKKHKLNRPPYDKQEAKVTDRSITPMKGMGGSTARVKIKGKDYYALPDEAEMFSRCEVVMIKKLFSIPGGNYR